MMKLTRTQRLGRTQRPGRTQRLGLTLVLLLSLVVQWQPAPGYAQAPDDAFLRQLIGRMTVEEKIGQLFLVTFNGPGIAPESEIAHLIQDYKIGAVYISASNGNFTNGPDTHQQLAKLTGGLQMLGYDASRNLSPTPQPNQSPTPQPSRSSPRPWIPLFIALQEEGDGYPFTQARGGLTSFPSSMSLGATWVAGTGERVGKLVGREMSAVGVNLLMGPSVDVLNNPHSALGGDLGVRTFSGDPYWVGQFARAYIQGVHQGSSNRVATVARHLPGQGASDRRPEEEIATVEKSLQELRRIELPPFFSITQGSGSGKLDISDALMTAHIRYRGFQGNIRQTTRPISLDAQGLGAIMALPEIDPWRKAGGILVSDGLGVPAVRQYYDPKLETFPYKRIAQDAFLAGNDILFLSQFSLKDDWSEHYDNIKSTVLYFQSKYTSDPTFQARVDDALYRVLRLKYHIYNSFAPERVVVNPKEVAAQVGLGDSEIGPIAQQAVTLLYPGPDELADRLPSPPNPAENIIIFTDDRKFKDCATCHEEYFIEPDALEKILLRLYGPKASGQVAADHVHSYTFTQLKNYLQSLDEKTSGVGTPSADSKTSNQPQVTRTPVPADLEQRLKDADWVIFAMLDVNTRDYPSSDALKFFLRQPSETPRNKKLIALSFNAPYYLDSTEITKLTAYYGMYSKESAFQEAAIRAIFREFTPSGAAPVSIEGLNYDLIKRTEPTPNQVIQISALGQPIRIGTPAASDSSASIDLKPGSSLDLVTAPILDLNNHSVPDGTPVTFRLLYPAESLELPRKDATTVNGVARTTIVLERAGQLEITASSDPALRSTKLVVTIKGDGPGSIVTVVPTPVPTETPSATPPPTATPSPTATSTPVEVAIAPPKAEEIVREIRRVTLPDLLLSLLGTGVAVAFALAYRGNGFSRRSARLRLALQSFMGGLVGYLAVGMGVVAWGEMSQAIHWLAPTLSMIGAAIPLLVARIRENFLL